MADVRELLAPAANPGWWRTWKRQHQKAKQYREWASSIRIRSVRDGCDEREEQQDRKDRDELLRLAEVYDQSLARMGETLAALMQAELQCPTVAHKVFEPDAVDPLEASAYVKDVLAHLNAQSQTVAPAAAPPTSSDVPATETQAEYVFARDGDGWFIRAFGESGRFRDAKGFAYLAKLLANPDRPVLMTHLIDGPSDGMTADRARNEGLWTVWWSKQPMADKMAIASVKRRIAECNQGIEDAQQQEDPVVVEAITKEREGLFAYLREVAGLNDNPRYFDSDSLINKLRANISAALRRVYRTLRKSMATQTASHLEGAISAQKDGFIYRPSETMVWNVVL